MQTGSETVARPKGTHRSKVSNGAATFLDGVDGRSMLARRYRDILAQIISDIGGDPSEAQSIIARRAATLAVWCETEERSLAQGSSLDISEFTTATNALRRLLADLGLERKAKDVTPDIRTYMAARAAEKPRAA
ncbi:hypothetical protein [Jiella sp. M17.18]|uniref:hypothetical protein n=1 Tax=Jiella sp. M17.18 TaxID=3234247 RepID=UPI0034DF6BFD